MKIALCQMDLAWLDVRANLNKIRNFLDQAEARDARLVVFPETTLTGFCMDSQKAALAIDSPEIREVVAMTRDRQAVVFVGAAIRRGRTITNECLVLRNGELLASYAKMNLFTPTDEHKHYDPGQRMLTLTVDGYRITPLICFDMRFHGPQVAGSAAGTDAFVVLACWPSAQSAQWKTLLGARAIDSQAFMIGVNRLGSGGGLDFAGECMIVAPSGKPLFEYSRDEKLIVQDVDLGYAAKLRERFPVFTEQYRKNAEIPLDHLTVRG